MVHPILVHPQAFVQRGEVGYFRRSCQALERVLYLKRFNPSRILGVLEIDAPKTIMLTPQRRDELLDDLARQLQARGLEGAGHLLLESHRPLAFLASQLLLALQPYWDNPKLEEYRVLLEDRANLDRLLKRLSEPPAR
ncbi:MAG: hypothetical protein HYZ68_03405 [Chloroflexi bacterium]|nr:hypothetical protein [Chloroflexota bacterium]